MSWSCMQTVVGSRGLSLQMFTSAQTVYAPWMSSRSLQTFRDRLCPGFPVNYPILRRSFRTTSAISFS